MSMALRARGLSAKRRSAGTAYFPSNAGLTPSGTNTDPTQPGGLILATLLSATSAGVVAKGIRFWMPPEGVGQTLTSFLFAGATGASVLAQGIDTPAVSGFNELLFATPYNMVNGAAVAAAIFIRPVSGDSLNNVSYSAVANALATAKTVSPLQTSVPGSRYNYGNPSLNGGGDTGTSSAWYGVDLMIAA